MSKNLTSTCKWPMNNANVSRKVFSTIMKSYFKKIMVTINRSLCTRQSLLREDLRSYLSSSILRRMYLNTLRQKVGTEEFKA